jgi:arginyl-tRNA synthetase
VLGKDGKKMSSRKGNSAGAEWLIDMTRDAVLAKTEGKLDAESADKIAVGALKYAFLRTAVGKDVVFDSEEAASFDGDTGAYAMYSYARCNSILEKVGDVSGDLKDAQLTGVELELARLVEKYPAIVKNAAENQTPNIVVDYIFDLAKLFSRFYEEVKVVGSEGSELALRVSFVKAVAQILKNGLYVLGISVVEKM